MSLPDSLYRVLGYISSSKYRRGVVRALESGPKTPSQIRDSQGYQDISHVSRALGELRDRDVVELLVPDETRKGRLYGLTGAGENLAEELEGD